MNTQRIFARFFKARNFQSYSIPKASARLSTICDHFFKLLTTRFVWQRNKLTVPPFATLAILGFIKKKDDEKVTKLTTQEILLAKADALFDQCEYKAIYELLYTPRDAKNPEVIWRLCRALYHMSRTASEVESKKLLNEGFDLAKTGLTIDNNHYAIHKWMAVLLDAKCNKEGMKSRISQLHVVKDHMLRAAELNPKDATTLYMLGSWCFEISNLAWYQRKLASAIFGTPPESTFDEALIYFEAAEKAEPNFYSRNLLMLGKTYLKLNKKDDALKYLKMAADYQAKNNEDHEAKKEAVKILNEI